MINVTSFSHKTLLITFIVHSPIATSHLNISEKKNCVSKLIETQNRNIDQHFCTCCVLEVLNFSNLAKPVP